MARNARRTDWGKGRTMRHILSVGDELDQVLLSNVQDGDSQPNAVDLRVKQVFSLNDAPFRLIGDEKQHRGSQLLPLDGDDCWNLEPGVYEIIMDNVVTVPEGYAGWVITRSTLNRNGLHITSGLYDSGYHGVMAGLLHVAHGPATIQKGSRVGQFIMFDAETLSLYDGDYGVGKIHDTKYVGEF